LSKLNPHRKGAKSAKEPGFSLAVDRNGKREGFAPKSNQVDLQDVPFSFPLSQRKAKKASLCVLCVSGEPALERSP